MPDPDPDPDADAGQLPGRWSPDDGDPMDLFDTLDMADLQSLLDAARESDEAAGDPLGEDAVEATLSGAGRVLSAAEMAGLAADGLAPGPGLGYWMGCFRPAEMDDFSLPGAAAACRRLASWAQATELAVVAEVAARTAARDEKVPVGPDRRPARVPDEAAAEVALALAMSQFGATCWTDLAVTLAWRLTGTSAALHDGAIDLSRARLIAEVTSVLDDRGARLVEDKILPDAGSKTLGQLRAALRRAVITVDPRAAERRREEAERKARVGLYGDDEGTATLSGQNLPGVRAAAAMARITALARALKASGATGGIDLLRAQVFVGLLLGTLPLIPPADDAPPGPADGGPPDPADDGPGRPPAGPGEGEPPATPGGGGPSAGPGGGESSAGPGGGGPSAGPGGGESSAGPGGGGPGDGTGTWPEDPWDGMDDPAGGDDPGGSCDVSDACDRDELGNPNDLSENGGSRGAAWIPAWPVVPGPGQVPAGLARSGAGALAGLPRGPASAGSASSGLVSSGSASTGLVSLTVPWRTLAGISAEPGQLSRLGPITQRSARDLAETAASDYGTEWKVIVTDLNGRAIAVTRVRRSRARSPGSGEQGAGLVSRVTLIVRRDIAQLDTVRLGILPGRAGPPQPSGRWQSWQPQWPGQPQSSGQPRWPGQPQSSGTSTGQGRLREILVAALAAARLATARADAEAAAGGPGDCAHWKSSSAYRPPPRLRDFVAARDQTCRFLPCRQPALRADQDHTIPYDQGGPTCECNLGGVCRTHHQVKQRPGWQLRQLAPGIFQWVTPAGRAYQVAPDTYPS